MTGGVQAGLLSSEITSIGLSILWLEGEDSTVRRAIASVVTEPAESENQGMYASSMHGNRELRGLADRLSCGRSGRGRPVPNTRYARSPEVGRRRSIDEANEQRCTTRKKRPTTGGARGEKVSGQGNSCAGDRDRHTGVGSSVEWPEQGTRGSSIASASDLRQEPGAVIPHAGICAGGAG